MRRINEVLHKVSDQLLNTLLGVRARPEAVFMAILEEEAPQISDPSDLAASLRSIG